MILDHDASLSCFKKEDVLWTRWDLGSKWNRIKSKLQTSLLILVFLKKEFSILERRITPPYAKNKTVVCATFPSLFQKYPVSKKRRGFRLRLASDSDRTARHEIILPVNYIFIPVKNQGSNVGWIRIEGEGKPRVLRAGLVLGSADAIVAIQVSVRAFLRRNRDPGRIRRGKLDTPSEFRIVAIS